MTFDDIKTIGLIGTGTMGQGITQAATLGGYNVVAYDINEDMLQKFSENVKANINKGIEKGKVKQEDGSAALARITTVNKLDDVKGELIIEAAIEKLTIKQDIFSKLEKQLSADTILATNTSSIPITRIAAPLQHPERVVGMHFFNPAHIMKLVEVISGEATNPQFVDVVTEVSKKMGKTPVAAKDAPGFIVNRVARHFYVESLKILEEGVADHTAIDGIIENCGFKMGPFRLMDLIGVDTNFSVTSSMFEAFHYDAKFRPSRIQQQKVDAGYHGRKAGKGFYSYE